MPLTKTMLDALECLRDGDLCRYDGGYWAHENIGLSQARRVGFSSRTILGLIERKEVVVVRYGQKVHVAPGRKTYLHPWPVRVRAANQTENT